MKKNLEKNKLKKIFKIVCVILVVILALLIYILLYNQSDFTTNNPTVTLNERQKNILKEAGLSTNYDELKISQKSAIERIEAMLLYLENKYNETFIYDGYVASSPLEKEHLTAYPASRDSNDIVTVYSEYEDGDYTYTDNYNNILVKDDYKNEIEKYFYSNIGTNIKVFVEISNSENYNQNDLIGTIWGTSYVFIDSSICDENKLNNIINDYSTWFKSESLGAARNTIICLVNKENLMNIFESNFEDKLRDKETILYEKEVAINAYGKITIY